MLNDQFNIGAFAIIPQGTLRFNDADLQKFDIVYGNETFARGIAVTPGTRDAVAGQLSDALTTARRTLRQRCELHTIELVESSEITGAGIRLGYFQSVSYTILGMTTGLIDDRARFWIRTADRMCSLDLTLDEYAVLRARYAAPENAWIANLLPSDVLTHDLHEWRAPTAWEIRHLVGEGSFTGISGAKAAALIGISPQNFRKYTASDSAANRQNISFAAWHLLLHRLNVLYLPHC